MAISLIRANFSSETISTTCSNYRELLLLVLLYFIIILPVAKADICVDANSLNDPGSGTQVDPFRKIQYGIDAAFDGTTVIVAEGIYYENINFNSKNITLTSTDPNDPCIIANTIIDGGSNSTVVSIIDANAVIEGFTVEDGYSDGRSPPYGGGIYCATINETPHIVRISKNIVQNNNYNGGIYCASNAATTLTVIISNNIIQNNLMLDSYWDVYGAGIYCDSYVKPVIVGNIIRNNRIEISYTETSGGGGIYCAGLDCNVSGNVIVGNKIDCWGNYNYTESADGGGVWVGGGIVSDNTVLRNYINSDYTWGNPNYVRGGGIYCNGPTTIIRNLVEDNSLFIQGGETESGDTLGAFGGGIYAPNCEITFNIVKGNYCEGYGGRTWHDYEDGANGIAFGGGIYAPGAIISNNLVAGNGGYGQGGDGGDYFGSPGQYSEGGDGIARGGGIYAPGATIINNTVADNGAGAGYGIGFSFDEEEQWAVPDPNYDGTAISEAAGIYADSYSVITNTIVWNNSPNQLYGQDCNNVIYCDIGDGTCGGQNGNISADPCFADPNYRLQCNSPCIDAGEPNADYSNEPHPNGNRINIGAYGNTAEAEIGCLDSDSDGIVNPLEIYWGLNPDSNDTDNDGLTDYQEVCYDGDCNNYSPYNPNTGIGTDLNATSPDTDNDKMPDGWEILYPTCVNPLNQTDPSNDCDGDGFTNLQEYLHGSNPTDVNDIPQPMSFYVDNDAPNDPGPNNPEVSDQLEDGTSEHPFDAIQKAIDFAIDSDTVMVLPGTYTGNGNRDIDYKGKIVIVRSIDPNGPNVVAATIIDCNGTEAEPHRGLYFHSGEGTNSVLDGFAITNGYAYGVADTPEASGGGISCLDNSNPTIVNCTIISNYAMDNGGGIGCWNSSPIISNCTIASNNASGSGAGLYCRESSPKVKNCIIYGNIPGEIDVGFGSLDITYSDIQSTWPGQGNIDADPCFADPCNGDYHLKSVAGRWDPNSQSWIYDNVTSPCIDAGDPNSDWTAELWPHGKRINMGAYGGTPQASMSPSIAGNIADLDNDGDVDFSDFGIFANNWTATEALLKEDLDRSGFVDVNDFVIYADNWLWVEDINLVGLWKFNETAGNYALDSSGHDNRGKLRNGPVWMGDAIYFDGIDDWIEVNDFNSLQMANQITISVWVYTEQHSTHYQEVVIKPYEQVADPYELYTIDLSPYGTFPRFIITDGIPDGDFGYAMNSNYKLSLNHWYQIVGTYDGSIVTLYVNGVLIDSNPATLSIGNNSMPVCIGSYLGTYNFKGLVDDVCIYNRGLTQDKVLDLYNKELPDHLQ